MSQFVELASRARETFAKEPSLIKLDAQRVLVVGDTHGDVDSTVKALRKADEYGAVLVFLGDYVDRGPYQIENITTLFERKTTEPSRLILLRGNHETLAMNTYYGFLETVSKRHGIKVYRSFLEAFTQMPYALVWRNVFMVHGGIAKGLETLEQVESVPKGEEDPSHEIGFQLLWNDPRENMSGFAESWRGGGALFFGEDVLRLFLERNKLELLVRAHEPMPNGYRYIFNRKLLTIFSCRYYNLPPKAALFDIHKKDAELIELG